ncbi:MbcA/ParS/Xre antitoxin family protein [Chitinophagaceae bacterium 26-R-25]|nr:MbcA/ParS/Xre antitoxin family protein [Chitinophagaceae bacterium 26-R-25]
MIKARKNYESEVLENVPRNINDSEILHLLYTTDINWKYVDVIKTFTHFNDDVLSDWLNISVKTFREYKKPKSVFKENVKEQVLLLLSLIKHGTNIFGSVREFNNWLNTENFYFDSKSPALFMNTITGIKFIDDRLTAMEYGDNV